MRRKKIASKVAVVILSAAMAMSPAISVMPVYAGDTTATEAQSGTETKKANNTFTVHGHIFLYDTDKKETQSDIPITISLKEGDKTLQTTTVNGSGDYSFAPITYTEAGEHDYNIVESCDPKYGNVVRLMNFEVSVHVRDDGNGSVAAYCNADAHPYSEIENLHSFDLFNYLNLPQADPSQADKQGILSGKVSVRDAKGNPVAIKAGQFKLHIVNPATGSDEVAVNAADGSYLFGPYLAKQAGEMKFEVYQESGSDKDMTYDTKKYTVTVTASDDGKALKYTYSGDSTTGQDLNFVNTYGGKEETTPEIEKKDISGKIVWDDDNNRDGVRPDAVEITLKADGKPIDTVKTDTDSYTFKEKPVKDEQTDKDIVYTVEEKAIDGYKTTYDGFNITNKHETDKKDISGKIVWDDENNNDGIRPKEVEVILTANGKEVKTVKSSDGSYDFGELPTKKDGKEIAYKVTEKEIDGYKTTYDGFDITNKHESEKIAVSGRVLWDDANDNDGLRPKEVEVALLADGKEVKTIKASDGSYDFGKLPAKKDGKAIAYKVSEKDIDGYTISYSAPASGTQDKNVSIDITNKHEIKKADIPVQIVWNDKDNQDKVRPDSVTIQLTADGENYGSAVTVKEGDGWTYTWKDAPVMKNGKTVSYKVVQSAVDKYTTEASMNGQTYVFTNTHTPIEKASVSGTVTWVDNNNKDKTRPDNVTIILTQDGKEIDRKTVSSSDSWKYDFGQRDKTDANGKAYTYAIKEADVKGYDIAVKGYDVTNTLKKSDDASKSDDKGGKTDNTTDGKSTGDVVTAVPVAVAAVAAGVMVGVLVAGKKKKKEEDGETPDTEKKEK